VSEVFYTGVLLLFICCAHEDMTLYLRTNLSFNYRSLLLAAHYLLW